MWWLLWVACVDPRLRDDDGDGVMAVQDCDDADPDVHPRAPERCDPPGKDEDCDGEPEGRDVVDGFEGWYDDDRDGWGAERYGASCDPAEVADRSGDCDDAAPDVFPGARELCEDDGIDENCDGVAWWLDDADGDGWGGDAFTSCAGAVQTWADCDDADPNVSPAAQETCANGVDDDCDGDALPCRIEGAIGPEDALGSLPGVPLAAGDLDGDGQDDLVTLRFWPDGRAELLTFLAPVTVGATPAEVLPFDDGARPTAVLDLDDDGALDLVVESWTRATQRVEAWYGPVWGRDIQSWAVDRLEGVEAVGDTDGDGRDEIVVRSEDGSWLLEGRPVGATVVEAAHVEIEGWADPVGDVDGDGLADLGLVRMPAPCSFGIVLAPLAPTVTPSDAVHCREDGGANAGGAWPVGDTDADGLGDLFVMFWSSGSDGYEYWSSSWGFLLRGSSLGEGPLEDPRMDADEAHAVGDVDGDGIDDLLTHRWGPYTSWGGPEAGSSRLALSDGAVASFLAEQTLDPTPLGYRTVPAGDYDDDGHIDLLLGYPDISSDGSSGRTWWFSSTGERW